MTFSADDLDESNARQIEKIAAVKRVQDEHGSHIEPALDRTWTLLEQLRWQAAVVGIDCGITPIVTHSRYSIRFADVWREQPDFFSVQVGGSSSGPHSFDSAWTYLNGIGAGVRAVR